MELIFDWTMGFNNIRGVTTEGKRTVKGDLSCKEFVFVFVFFFK